MLGRGWFRNVLSYRPLLRHPAASTKVIFGFGGCCVSESSPKEFFECICAVPQI